MNAKRLSYTVLLFCLLLSACAPAAAVPTPTNTVVMPQTGTVQKQGAQTTDQYASPSTAPMPTGAPAQPQMEGNPIGGAPYAAPAQPGLPAPQEKVGNAPMATAPGYYPQVPPIPPSPWQPSNPPQDNTFQNYGINPFVDARHDHLSTFGLDVDTASYTVMRRYLNDGNLPPADSVRVEEYVNFFNMGYKTPPDVAFGIYADGAPSPFSRDGTSLLRIGIQGYQVSAAARKPSNLVFVIDVSGSMSMENRLELVKRSLQLLVERLRPDDSVGIVVFGTSARVLLEPVSGANKGNILEAIYSLQPEGSTNVDAGLRLGYDMSMRTYRQGANNKVILCSDGVANTGTTQAEAILDNIYGYVAEGITLNTVGFGMGNFNDTLMEKMADKGNGSYSYVDNIDEAKRLFVDKLTSTLQVIARDAKVQVDFNPDVVARYRLLGYENRAIADQNFRNDSVDAGEIGAGHSATAIYAVQLFPGTQGRIATVQLRWKEPETYQVREINGNFNTWDISNSFEQADPRYRLAAVVGQFAEILRNSPYARGSSLEMLRNQAYQLVDLLPGDPDVMELARLIDRANQINPYPAE